MRQIQQWASGLPKRLNDHATGHGARLLSVITDAGIGWTLARTWPNTTRTYERCLKNQGGASRRCPVCRATSTDPDAALATPALAPLLGIDPATGQVRTHAVCDTCHQDRGLIDFDLSDPVSHTCLLCGPRPARYHGTAALVLRPAWSDAA